jgi:N-acetylglucosamine kinase-like BadF-type ATPase
MLTRQGRLLLGVDGGGTSTIALLGHADGEILGRGTAGPSNAKAVGIEAARRALEDSIDRAFEAAGLALSTADVACLGLAGFDRPEDRQVLGEWTKAGRWADRLLLVNDGDLVVAAGTPEGWGIGIIAGTGSIAVGRAPDGRKARAGGWGHLIGEEGSGYAVVLAALRKLARRADGREKLRDDMDPLSEHLCRALGIPGTDRLVSTLYAPGFDRSRIAALAPAVLAAAVDDHSIDRELLHPAGEELAEMAISVAQSLGWFSGSLRLALAGGFLLSSDAVRQSLLGHLGAWGYDPRATEVHEPALGAIVLAKRSLESQ